MDLRCTAPKVESWGKSKVEMSGFPGIRRTWRLESPAGLLHEPEVDRHELGDEGLEVVDRLVPLLQPVLVQGRDLAELGLELAVADLDQLLLQGDEDHLGRDAVGDKLVEPGPHLCQL